MEHKFHELKIKTKNTQYKLFECEQCYISKIIKSNKTYYVFSGKENKIFDYEPPCLRIVSK